MRLTTTGRRVIAIAIAAAVVFTIVAAVLALVLPDDHGDDADALWLFGFQTVKVQPDHPSHRTTLRSTAFGEVVGFGDTVYMYDAGSGQFGTIDAASNDFRQSGRVRTSFTNGQQPVAPSIAVTRREAWLVTGPGRIVRMPLGRTAQSPTAVVSLPGEELGATRVVTTGNGAVAVYATQNKVRAVRLDADGRTIAAANLDDVEPSELVSVVTSGERVIALTPSRGLSFQANRPAALDVFDLRAAVPGGVATAAASATQLWLVDRSQPNLVRVDPQSGRVRVRTRYLSQDQPFRQPTQVLVAAGEVWLLAPTSTDPNRHDAEVLRFDPVTGRVRTRIVAPSNFFVGAIARTTGHE
jgi:hypothetical protein